MLNKAIECKESIPDSTLSTMGRRAYDEVLGNLRLAHAQEPDRATSLRLNRCITDMLWLLKVVGSPFRLDDVILDALREHQGWDDQRIDDLVDTFRNYDDGALVLNDKRIAAYLADQGLQPTAANMVATAQTILPYLHDAARQAHARLTFGGSMQPLSSEASTSKPFDPEQLLRLLQANVSAQAVLRNNEPVSTLTQGEALRMSDVVDRFVIDRKKALGRDSLGQVRQAAELFIFTNGNLPIKEIKQPHIGDFVRLMDDLPSRYGRTKSELEGGLQASIVRGLATKQVSPEKVGLSRATINKHLTWLDQLLSFADSAYGINPLEELSFKKLRQVGLKMQQKTRKSEKRLSWTDDELGVIFAQPVWSGSAGLFDRLQPGDHVWHDAWYFVPLALALHGTRSEEISGLSLAEVHKDAPIPYISLRETAYRSLKNAASIRDLPISPELIRLGFLDYVRELRRIGKKLAFPEMHSPARTMDFDNVFYKQIFSKLRAHCFPEGTDWFKRNGGLKEKDVHSMRGSTANMLLGKVEDAVRQDVLGHTGASETRQTYDEAAALSLKLQAIDKLSFLTAHIVARPLNMRSAEWLGYGQPRGRRANGGRPTVPKRVMPRG